MGKYVTISVKVPLKIKEELEKYGIKPSELLKKAIAEELRIKEVEEIKKEIEELKETIEKISTDFIVKSIREDRNSR